MSPLKLKVSENFININNNNNHSRSSNLGNIMIGKSNNFTLAQKQSNVNAKLEDISKHYADNANENDIKKQQFLSTNLSPNESYNRNKRSAVDLIMETQNSNQTSMSATTPKRKVRKFLIRRIPHQQNKTDINTSTEQILPKKNPRRRVLILKHKLSRSVDQTLTQSITSTLLMENKVSNTPKIDITAITSPISIKMKTISIAINETPTTIEPPTEAAPSNRKISNKRCKSRSQQRCQRRRNGKPKSKKLQPQPVIGTSTIALETYTDILTHYETLATISLETTLRPRTYTYVIDRVHDNQHEIQTSMLIRDHLTVLTHTLTVTKTITSTTLRLLTPTY